MRYHYIRPDFYIPVFGKKYICNHPVYTECTLFKNEKKGLAIIQQRFDPETKTTWWGEIDPWLINDLYLHDGFEEFFNKRSGNDENGLYPTVSIRQIMWALHMKPLKRERWETVFDRKSI